MELKLLGEVDLREAIGPINRAVTGHYLPSVRTVSNLRERAALGVLDLKLSRCAFLGGKLVGTCLVERVDELAHLDAIGVEPLAQQRGVGHALLESACVAAEAASVKRFTAEVAESDAPALATLLSAGFRKRRALLRFGLRGVPAQLPLPEELPLSESSPAGRWAPFVRQVELTEALDFIAQRYADHGQGLPFAQQASVLLRLKSKLTSFLLLRLDKTDPIVGAAVIEKDRQRLLTLGGDPEHLTSLISLLLMKHGVTTLDSLQEDHEAVPALQRAGLPQIALRGELGRNFGSEAVPET